MDFVDANLLDVLQAITNVGGMNLVVSADGGGISSKKISVSLKNIGPLEAIDFILRTNGYSYELEDNIVLVSSLPQDLLSSAYKNNFEVINLKHLLAEKAFAILEKINLKTTFAIGPDSNSLLLKGKVSDIGRIKELLFSMDKPSKQVLIESKVVEVSEAGIEELGIKWGKEEGKFKFSIDKETGMPQCLRIF